MSSPVRRPVGLVLGVALFAILMLFPAPGGLSGAAWRTAAVGVLMASWWVTEAIPIPATALLPLALFPVLGIGTIGEAAAPFANPLIYLFLGGFLVAKSMQGVGLPRRIALETVRLFGTRPGSVIAGIMAASAFLSMWVSNTATALMMLPIGISLIELLPGEADEPSRSQFGTALMLGIAYACSIGGMGTLIGTPPNAFLAGFMLETYGVEIGFAQWMLLGVPLALVGLPLAWLILTRFVFPVPFEEIPGGAELIQSRRQALGPMRSPEKRVAAVFALTALAWMTRPLLQDWIPGLSDAGIAIGAALLLFLIPSGEPGGGRLLTWRQAEATPWGVLVLFGGGLSLAAAIGRTGLGDWLGGRMETITHWPLVLLVAAVVATVILLTELTSNTATAATFLPVLGAVALAIGQDPLVLAVPAALAASGAFMLPVATPPNAIVYGSGAVEMTDMVRAGVWINLLFTLLITAASRVFVPVVFGL
ncbi:MAG: DASS family sodium-coupled anion symporter [marine benthic group bacterium]|nr:DASS family sodium-coupled anion symporter [Gemmatimonadota bacterium]